MLQFSELSIYMRTAYSRKNNPPRDHYIDYNPWTIAQIVTGLNQLRIDNSRFTIDNSEALGFFNGSVDSECNCWYEFRNDNSEDYIPITSWILISLKQLGVLPKKEYVEFLLKHQSANGWWPIRPSTDDEKNSSTYSTAITILSLYNLYASDYFKGNDALTSRIKNSIVRGVTWLVQHNKNSRWLDHPNDSISADYSISISGLIVHLFHRISERPELIPLNDTLKEIDRAWLESLPRPLPDGSDTETSEHTTKTDGGLKKHDVSYVVLPWIIIATKDAYTNGTIKQKIEASTWIDDLLIDLPKKAKEARKANFMQALLLISLRYINGDNIV